MKIKTAEATPAQLNWLAATIEGLEFDEDGEPIWFEHDGLAEPRSTYAPATDRSQGGQIIEREKIQLYPDDAVMPKAILVPNASEPHFYYRQYGPTPLIAAMRCWVAYKMGDEVEIPEGLA